MRLGTILTISFFLWFGCTPPPGDVNDNVNDNINDNGTPEPMDDGPVADGISGRLGEALPSATAAQLAAFQRGREVFQKRFDLADGLGPVFNVTFCGACHEKPVPGGSSGLYRNFFLGGRLTSDGAFLFSDSEGDAGGVLRVFNYDPDIPSRPTVPDTTTIFAQRNGIPTFGAGLIAALDDEEILKRVDPNDADGDGISGRANFDRGFAGRFGRKAQVVSIEAFIRGPLFNHLGITTDPLADEERSKLPVDSSLAARTAALRGATPAPASVGVRFPHQAAAADDSTTDDDGVPDPEMTPQELFDLISFVQLLAAPELEEPTEQSNRGRLLFHEANCSGCHTPRLEAPQGPIAIYSDLLLHDMGDELADHLVMKDASGSEFRTQPLWGVSATGPYLHDGRVNTIEGAILAHGGEALKSRDTFAAFSSAQKADVIEFLMSLGGRDQMTDGLLPPDEPVPDVGEYGGPFRTLTAAEQDQFVRGRAVFDMDFGFDDGAGALAGSDGVGRFNGDSCRACHFDPVIGGAGPRDVNVMRHGIVDGDGVFSAPPTTPNTILHKEIRIGPGIVEPTDDINVFEHRQPPHTFGMGLISAIADATILANEDPNDTNSDGISGRAHVLADDRIGRLGWKAQVPDITEFVGDAMAAEIGLTLPAESGISFSIQSDGDGVPDPELSVQETEDIIFYLTMLGGPPRQFPAGAEDLAQVSSGQILFTSVGCAKCHIPSLNGTLGTASLYSDLLLHEILPEGKAGIEDGDASQREFRTTPLWGLSTTAPYFHTGEADTIEEAIELHDGEAVDIRAAFEALPSEDREALLAFLNSL